MTAARGTTRQVRGLAEDPRRPRLRDVEQQLEQVKRALLAGADPAALAPEINRLHAEAEALRQLLVRERPAKPRPVSVEQVDQALAALDRATDSWDAEQLRRFVVGRRRLSWLVWRWGGNVAPIW